MWKVLALVVSIAGCTDDDEPSPHDTVPCSTDPARNGWAETGQCARACETAEHTMGPLDMCQTNYGTCARAFTFEGVRGCCTPLVNPSFSVRFDECI